MQCGWMMSKIRTQTSFGFNSGNNMLGIRCYCWLGILNISIIGLPCFCHAVGCKICPIALPVQLGSVTVTSVVDVHHGRHSNAMRFSPTRGASGLMPACSPQAKGQMIRDLPTRCQCLWQHHAYENSPTHQCPSACALCTSSGRNEL